MKIFKRLLKAILALILLGIAAIAGLYFYFSPDLPDAKLLKTIELQTPLKVYTADGLLISQYGEKRRIPLTLDQVPKRMQQAFLAIEDSRFYIHPGIDPIGISRAVFSLIVTGKKKQGASTITQQVARNYFLTREKTFTRKIKEVFLAWNIEQELTKDEILLAYLNKIPLGHRSFGVGAAAQVYYGKDVNDLTLAEMAVIAGLPKAPSTLNPIRSPERSRARRNLVLKRMLKLDYINQQEYQQASSAPTTAKRHGAQIELYAPYLGEMVRSWMVAKYGRKLAYSGGFNVFTTVPSTLQLAAQEAVATNIRNYDLRHGYRGPAQQWWDLTSDNEQQTPTIAITAQEIIEKLSTIADIKSLQPAVVIKVNELSVNALLKTGQEIEILWDQLKWARAFIDDSHQGPAPKTASDILSEGALIRTTLTEAGWTLSQSPEVSSALISLDPNNGAIRAIVGGYNFAKSQFNRATQAKRQIGSNIKPFIYSYAMSQDFTLASIIQDSPITKWNKSQGLAWRPKNSPPVYNGPTRLRLGLAQSKNVMSVKLIRQLGIKGTINHLTKFGFNRKDLPYGESLALGSASVSPLEAATGYATFANGGFKVDSHFIDRVENQRHHIIYQSQPLVACLECEKQPVVMTPIEGYIPELTDDPELFKQICLLPLERRAPRVISQQNAFLVSDMMRSVIKGGGSWSKGTGWSGTGWRAGVLKRDDIGGKTGTTNDSKDTWYSGVSPQLIATVWVGFDNPSRSLGKTRTNRNLGKGQITGKEAGAKTAQPQWIEYMKVALQHYPQGSIAVPEGITTVRIDRATGLLTTKTNHTSRFEYFIHGTEPTEYVEPAQIELDNDSSQELDSNFEDDIF